MVKGCYFVDEEAFLFSLDDKVKCNLKPRMKEYAVYDHP